MHWLATPIGWPVATFSLLAAVGVVAASGWIPGTSEPSTVDLIYYLNPQSLLHRTNLATVRDYLFVISMLAAVAVMLWWVMRTASARFARKWLEDVREDRPTHLGRRHALVAFGLLITSGGAILGWPYRLAQHWVAQLAKGKAPSPAHFSAENEAIAALRAAVVGLPQPDQRMTGLRLLIEDCPAAALPILTEAVSRERDGEVRSVELRLIGLHRRSDTVDLLRKFLSHGNADTRAAAADAIGLVHAPAYDAGLAEPVFLSWPAVMSGNTQIDIGPLALLRANPVSQSPVSLLGPTPLDGSVRSALETMMLTGATLAEREAAARSLLAWPPDNYQLRVAEWGVWINNGGQLKLVQSVLDEIPPFVHRTGNPLSEFAGRVNQIMFVTKPILHFTVDRPLAVDVNVLISGGRPWFAYPLPDDFAVRVENVRMLALGPLPTTLPTNPPLAVLDNPALAKLTDLRQGYPWMVPHHISDGPTGGAYFGINELIGLGVRWQSIIASPTQLPWMTPPEVGTDPHFAWWRRLRDVPSAWLSSRGESERFLYYDGPTLSPAPADVTLSGNVLRIACNNEEIKEFGNWRTPDKHNQKPQGVLLIHHRNALLSGQAITMPPVWDLDHPNADFTLADDDLHENQVIDELRKMLTTAGLTAAEAEGLVASWTPQFFQTDGTRVLFIMSKEDYDALCPIQIRPTPTEMVRVGIVLTEL